jgi:hypothetical protein
VVTIGTRFLGKKFSELGREQLEAYLQDVEKAHVNKQWDASVSKFYNEAKGWLNGTA